MFSGLSTHPGWPSIQRAVRRGKVSGLLTRRWRSSRGRTRTAFAVAIFLTEAARLRHGRDTALIPAAATSRLSCAPSVWTLPPAAGPDSSVCRLSIPLHCGYRDSASIALHSEVCKSDETVMNRPLPNIGRCGTHPRRWRSSRGSNRRYTSGSRRPRSEGSVKTKSGRDAAHIGHDRQYGRATSSGQDTSNTARGDACRRGPRISPRCYARARHQQ